MSPMRQPGDPWYTFLYRDPYRLWWAQTLFVFAALLALHRAMTDDDWTASLIFAGGVSAVSLVLYRPWTSRD